jgi:hypothetical protein
MDLSGYLFGALRKDEEFILCRGQSKDVASQAAFARDVVGFLCFRLQYSIRHRKA